MAEISSNGNHEVAMNIKDTAANSVPQTKQESGFCVSIPFIQKIGELAGLAVGATVLLNVMFAGPPPDVMAPLPVMALPNDKTEETPSMEKSEL
ncbi:hypothetical protein L1049_010526 [Liquidambar formosana]|uniref:Uncharacterized protein n=1 Tax=Liquidambar formosana TaxID=63359 RepID=A0AAP0N9H4_LIQFO